MIIYRCSKEFMIVGLIFLPKDKLYLILIEMIQKPFQKI